MHIDEIMRRTRINIKKLLKESHEEGLSRIGEERSKMLRLVFKKDFKGLKTQVNQKPNEEKQRLLKISPKTNAECLRDLAKFTAGYDYINF